MNTIIEKGQESNNPFLSILIPTYNRAKPLEQNLELLVNVIKNNHLEKDVTIEISNNHSTDNTANVVQKFIHNDFIKYYEQDSNIGGTANLLFLIKVAQSNYIMFNGDDDFIHDEYLPYVINKLKSTPTISCITSNCISLDKKGNTNFIREPDAKDQFYPSGFFACYSNIWRAHQISAIVLRREGLYEEYIRHHNLHTMYPQMFLVGFQSLHGDVFFASKYPYVVSDVPQDQKDWDYGKDGLMRGIFNVFKELPISYKERIKLELSMLNEIDWRLGKYKMYAKFRALFLMSFGKNTTTIGGLYIFFSRSFLLIKRATKSTLKKLVNR